MKRFKFPEDIQLRDLTTGEYGKDEKGEVVPPVPFKRIALRWLCNPALFTDYKTLAIVTKLINRVSDSKPGDEVTLDDSAHKVFCEAIELDVAAKQDPVMGAVQLLPFAACVMGAADAD